MPGVDPSLMVARSSDALENHDQDRDSEYVLLCAHLRSAAVNYAKTGWPILALSPAGDRLVAGLSPDPETAFEWWSDQPYGIGCRLGEQLDAVEVPADVGELILDRARRQYPSEVPVIAVPGRGTQLFLVAPGAQRIVELAAYRQVRLHSRGTWIPLPPTRVLGAEVRWISQQQLDHLPHSLNLQWITYRLLRRSAAPACGSAAR
jgi:hypothetical protein